MEKNTHKWTTRDKWVGVIILGVIIWGIFIYLPSSTAFEGMGIVNLFPDPSHAKNYRLDAEVGVRNELSSPFSYRTMYGIMRVDWPNGGYSYFKNCEIPKSGGNCTAEDGTPYFVEVVYEPDNSDSSSD